MQLSGGHLDLGQTFARKLSAVSVSANISSRHDTAARIPSLFKPKARYPYCSQRRFTETAGMGSSSQVAIPPSNSTVTLSVVDTTSWAYKLPCSDLFLPRFPGLETFDICSLAFLITHNDRHVLFDLGIKKNWENLIPGTVSRLKESGTVVKVEKELVDILRDGGIDPMQQSGGMFTESPQRTARCANSAPTVISIGTIQATWQAFHRRLN